MHGHIIYWVSEWLLLNANLAIFQLYHSENKLIFNEMMMRSALYYTNTRSGIYSASSLKQQSACRHVASLWHIILNPSQPVFALAPKCCVLSGKATNTNFVVFGVNRPGLEPTIYRTLGQHANHYATDVVNYLLKNWCLAEISYSGTAIHFFHPKYSVINT